MARREMNYYTAASGRRHRSSFRRNSYPGVRTPSARGDGRRGFSIFDWLMLVVSAAVAAGFALSWMSRMVPPASYGVMSAAGLFAPALFAANFVCLLYWVIRWRRGVYLPLVVAVLGMWNLTLFFKPALTRRHADHSTDRSLLNVTSYNVRGMLTDGGAGGRLRSSIPEVAAAVDSLRPDVLCLQEFRSTAEYPSGQFEERIRGVYNYKTVRTDFSWGNAIYSKYPIARSGLIEFENTSNSILWADVVVRRDTLRVFNAHLQTTAVKATDERYIVGMDFVGDDNTSRLKGILGRLRDNYIIRAAQADTLAARIAASPHAVVVCGDFNDTPVSWAYRRISHGLGDSFREAGRGYGHTYRGFFDLLRIDYMLHSRSVECVEYASPSFDASDHNPVAVRLRIGPKKR